VKEFEQGDRVVVNECQPGLEGETGSVTNPEYIGFVMVDLEKPQMRGGGWFSPEELEKQ